MDNFCLDCGTPLMGRVDKKFCNDQCRNNYHNKENREDSALIRYLNAILRKNRNILKNLNPVGKAKVKKQELVTAGFNFKYFTNLYQTKDKRTYYFVYEHGYTDIGNDYFALVINKEI
jgi:predicted nucleic acid-binding Zn ribbon protein